MRKFFKPFFSFFRVYKQIGNISIAYRLLPNNFTPVIKGKALRKGGDIEFTAYGKKLTSKQIKLFGSHGELLLKFIRAGSISFLNTDTKDEHVSVSINGKRIIARVENHDNLKVLEEVFIDQLYNFHSSCKYVVCDAGMNVGAAALYFASFDNVEKVYGFEPFVSTYELACSNIRLNSWSLSKIETRSYGLGKMSVELSVPRPTAGSLGGTTTSFMIDDKNQLPGSGYESVSIKDVHEVVSEIRDNHPGCKVILKLDCEGAEYDIIDRLEAMESIREIDVYMIEYHIMGKGMLERKLEAAGFYVLGPGNEDVNPFGMLYALKR